MSESDSLIDTLLDFEETLIMKLGWDLCAIDNTSIDSMFMFVAHLGGGKAKAKQVYCDQVNWL